MAAGSAIGHWLPIYGGPGWHQSHHCIVTGGRRVDRAFTGCLLGPHQGRDLLMFARGFSLIEMLVVVAIAGIVLAIAVPSFQETMVNGRSRGVAESIQFGLIKARSEAISRNAPMRFQIVSTLDATCTASSTSRLWVVTQYTGLAASVAPLK